MITYTIDTRSPIDQKLFLQYIELSYTKTITYAKFMQDLYNVTDVQFDMIDNSSYTIYFESDKDLTMFLLSI